MEKKPSPFKKYVFVCVNKREEGACCHATGGEAIRDRLKQMVKDRGLQREIRVSRAGCLDVCKFGPNLLVFPDNVWYCGVKLEDLERILEEILENKPA